MAEYMLRPVTDADYDFLYDLNRTTMRAYVEPLWGWDESIQCELFQQRFTLEGHFIIVVDGEDAGRLRLDRFPERDFISQINLLPAYQGRGIGSAVIHDVLMQAKQAHKPVELRVLNTNPDARRLYQRLGFVVFEQDDVRCWMRWSPSDTT